MKTYRGYYIKPFPQSPSLYVVSVEGGAGSIPGVLEGLYTSPSVAIQKIDLYLDNKEGNDGRKSNKTVKQSGA